MRLFYYMSARSIEACEDTRPKCLSVNDCTFLQENRPRVCGFDRPVTECYECSPSAKEDADTCKSCRKYNYYIHLSK